MHWTKRARSATEQDPLAGAGQGVRTAETIVVSPQPSPLREDVVQIPPTGAGTKVPSSKPDKEVREARQEEERQEADPVVAPPSTIVPESASPTRVSTDEPARTEAAPPSEAADDRAPAMRVAREGDALPQQTPMGNPLVFKHLS